MMLRCSSVNFDKYNNIDDQELNNKYQNDFKLHLLKAIILKNQQSHQAPDSSRLKLIENLHSTLIAELWIVDFFKKELNNAIKIVDLRKRDFGSYIDTEIEKYKQQSSKFVSLNLKELTSVAGNPGRSMLIDTLITNELRRISEAGRIPIIEVDTCGAIAINKTGLEGNFLFVYAPSFEELRKRIGNRIETEEEFKKRIE